MLVLRAWIESWPWHLPAVKFENGSLHRIESIQFLRGIAALLVVIFHLFDELKLYTSININKLTHRTHILGNIGVDIFFCISGFIMIVVLSRPGLNSSRLQFLKRRFIRIVPVYWLITTLMLLAHIIQFIVRPSFALPTVPFTLSSYFFIPMQNGKGVVAPLVSPGWTLSYEMLFYLILFFIIPRPVYSVTAIATTLLTGCVVAGFVLQPSNPLLQVITSPLLFEFVFGMLTGVFMLRLHSPNPLVATICIGISVLIVGWTYDAVISDDLYRLVIRGIPAGFFLFGILHLNQSLRIWKWPPLSLLGAASYSLYLTHDLVVPILFRVCFGVLHLPLVATLVGSLIVTLSVAFLFFRYVEQPIITGLTGWNEWHNPPLH